MTKFSFPPTVFSPLLQGKIPDTHTHESGELEAKLAEQPGRRREHQSPGFLLGGFLFFFVGGFFFFFFLHVLLDSHRVNKDRFCTGFSA